MPALAEALEHVSESATLAINAKAQQLIAAGKPVINLSAGQPDFEPPAHVVSAASTAASAPECHRYGSSQGRADLRAAVAERYSGSQRLATEQVLISNGAKQAIYNFLRTVLTDGDEVLLPVPYWPTFPAAVLLNGGRPVPVVTRAEEGYAITVEALEAAKSGRTRVLVVATPGNPSGAIQPEANLNSLIAWARANDVWVLFDRTYEDLVFEQDPLAALLESGLSSLDHCVTVSSVSKGFAMPGWRVGWAVGNSTVISAMTRVQSHSSSNVSMIAQAAALAALTGPRGLPQEMTEIYKQRSAAAQEALRGSPSFRLASPAGAFFLFLELPLESYARSAAGIPHVRDIGLGGILTQALLDQEHIAVVPGIEFGNADAIRVSLTAPNEVIGSSMLRINDRVESIVHTATELRGRS